MECLVKNSEKKEVVNKNLEKIILKLIKDFYIEINSSYGFDANSDNGIQDMKYSTNTEEMVFENFIVDNDAVVGYRHISDTVDFKGVKDVNFDGSKEVLIYSWDDSKYGGSTDFIDKGSIRIVKKK